MGDLMAFLCPEVTDGYLVTEKDLRTDEFKVTATCAAGWSGAWTAEKEDRKTER